MSLELGQPPADREDTAGPAAGGTDGPLLADAANLRANWQRLQAGFVDDPHGALADAADLVEHAAQALVGALRQRQKQLRGMWDDGTPRDDGTADTEQLRLVLLRYRTVFNQICRP